jgi:hypothetical protein
MPRDRLLARCLIAAACALALPAQGQTPPVPTASAALPPSLDGVSTFPLLKTVDATMIGYRVGLILPDQRAKALALIGALPREQQTLFWLDYLYESWGGPALESIHTFLFLESGDYAPQVLQALRDAGLSQRADILQAAMAEFGRDYPLDHAKRETWFAWSKPGRQIAPYTSEPNPLNPFDEKLMAAARAFGTRGDYRAAVEAYAAHTPALAAWLAETGARVSDEDRLGWLTDQLQNRARDEATVATWPAAYRALYLVSTFNDEMLNGSVDQYFANSSGDGAPALVPVLRDLGLAKHADAVAAGMAMFGTPYPTDRKARSAAEIARRAAIGDTQWESQMERLTAAVDDGAMITAMMALAKRENLLPR